MLEPSSRQNSTLFWEHHPKDRHVGLILRYLVFLGNCEARHWKITFELFLVENPRD